MAGKGAIERPRVKRMPRRIVVCHAGAGGEARR
jgi:hypothetical protein